MWSPVVYADACATADSWRIVDGELSLDSRMDRVVTRTACHRLAAVRAASAADVISALDTACDTSSSRPLEADRRLRNARPSVKGESTGSTRCVRIVDIENPRRIQPQNLRALFVGHEVHLAFDAEPRMRERSFVVWVVA